MILRYYQEDGVVKKTWGTKQTWSVWVECPEHGREQPFTEPAYDWQGEPREGLFIMQRGSLFVKPHKALAVCGQEGSLLEICLMPRSNGGYGKCNARCLNGVLECNCSCEGRCHGQGICTCQPATKEELRELKGE